MLQLLANTIDNDDKYAAQTMTSMLQDKTLFRPKGTAALVYLKYEM